MLSDRTVQSSNRLERLEFAQLAQFSSFQFAQYGSVKWPMQQPSASFDGADDDDDDDGSGVDGDGNHVVDAPTTMLPAVEGDAAAAVLTDYWLKAQKC